MYLYIYLPPIGFRHNTPTRASPRITFFSTTHFPRIYRLSLLYLSIYLYLSMYIYTYVRIYVYPH